MDNLTKEQRKKTMQAIKSKNTKAELILRRELWKKGYRYRKNYSKLPGSPDIVFLKHKVVIFCDGEFWHGYNWSSSKYKIKTNRDYWWKKIEDNMKRDMEINQQLESSGWTVLRFWNKDIIKNTHERILEIEKYLK